MRYKTWVIITVGRLAVPGWLVRVGICIGLGLASSLAAQAADHGDAPLVSNDQGADIADVYAFLDPNDNDYLVTIITARGFITPGESENLGFFQDNLNWRFAIETGGEPGDASPDFNAEVTFSPRRDFVEPQTAFVSLRKGRAVKFSFEALTTPPSSTSHDAPDFVVTHDEDSDITFFAGMVDDPFFFDVPAELQFRTSLITSAEIEPPETTAPGADPTVFQRRIDTFKGFNVMAVALRIPLARIEVGRMKKIPGSSTGLGVSGYTEPTQFTTRSREFGVINTGPFVNVDRMGIPGINTVLLPYFDPSCSDCGSPKDTYNRGSTSQDAAGPSAAFIVQALTDLKTNEDNIGFLAELVVNNGDILRLDTTVRNRGNQGGGNAAAAFPNGRRLADDPMDTVVNIIANQLFDGPPFNGVVDNVNKNDKRFGNEFPFLAPPHQPKRLACKNCNPNR